MLDCRGLWDDEKSNLWILFGLPCVFWSRAAIGPYWLTEHLWNDHEKNQTVARLNIYLICLFCVSK